MKISIAMATYNGERFLRAQLDSLSKQSRLPDELVVTDDSESSATFDILAEFSRSAPFAVRLYRNERRLGYRANFFKAMSLCTGDIIFPCDQDDVWQSEKISKCAPSFVDLRVLLVFHQMTIVSEDLCPCSVQETVPFRGRYPALAINPFYFPPGMSLAVRAELVRLLDFSKVEVFDEKVFGHDSWLWTTSSSLGEVVVLRERLLLYRQHSENVFGAAVLKGSKIPEKTRF